MTNPRKRKEQETCMAMIIGMLPEVCRDFFTVGSVCKKESGINDTDTYHDACDDDCEEYHDECEDYCYMEDVEIDLF